MHYYICNFSKGYELNTLVNISVLLDSFPLKMVYIILKFEKDNLIDFYASHWHCLQQIPPWFGTWQVLNFPFSLQVLIQNSSTFYTPQ